MIRIELGCLHGIWGYRLTDANSQIENMVGFASANRALESALERMEEAFRPDDCGGFQVSPGRFFANEDWKWPDDKDGAP